MNMQDLIKIDGIVPTVPTPFNAHEQIDWSAMRQLLDFACSADVAAVCLPACVSRQFGTPFLAATQVFDVQPIPRKWLALAKTSDDSNRFVKPGMILITCSGSVGRPTLGYAVHENILGSPGNASGRKISS
jgi:hypothetical protein